MLTYEYTRPPMNWFCKTRTAKYLVGSAAICVKIDSLTCRCLRGFLGCHEQVHIQPPLLRYVQNRGHPYIYPLVEVCYNRPMCHHIN